MIQKGHFSEPKRNSYTPITATAGTGPSSLNPIARWSTRSGSRRILDYPIQRTILFKRRRHTHDTESADDNLIRSDCDHSAHSKIGHCDGSSIHQQPFLADQALPVLLWSQRVIGSRD